MTTYKWEIDAGLDYMLNDADDDTEMWKEFHKMKEAKKKANLDYSTKYLKKHDIPYTSHNNGVHLVVDSRVDFWPSTGKWIIRGEKGSHRGLMALVKWINNDGEGNDQTRSTTPG